MTQPIQLGERIVTLAACLHRLVRLIESAPPASFPEPLERQRAVEEARDALAQHVALERRRPAPVDTTTGLQAGQVPMA